MYEEHEYQISKLCALAIYKYIIERPAMFEIYE